MKSKQKPREGWHSIGQGSESCGFLELSVDYETAQQSEPWGCCPTWPMAREAALLDILQMIRLKPKPSARFHCFHFASYRSAHHTSGFVSQLYQGIL